MPNAIESRPTCDLCDEHKASDSDQFRSLPMVFKNFGANRQFSGRIRTVKCYEDNTLVKAAVEGDGKGQVLVVDGGRSLRRALLGGNLGLAAARNGWAGLLINGCVRDVTELAPLPIGIGKQPYAHRPERARLGRCSGANTGRVVAPRRMVGRGCRRHSRVQELARRRPRESCTGWQSSHHDPGQGNQQRQ
jgi:RraA family protein